MCYICINYPVPLKHVSHDFHEIFTHIEGDLIGPDLHLDLYLL